MFQITVTYNCGDIHLNFAYADQSRRPKTRKAKGGKCYQAILAWCSKHGKAVGYGENWQTWQFNSPVGDTL